MSTAATAGTLVLSMAAAITYRRRWWVHQDLAPALPTRVAIEQAMFHGRLRTERDYYTAPRAALRAR